jgi:hypothetical protein
LYPSPEARTSCDIDVFYDKARRADVEEILTAFGFEKHSDSANHGEWVKDEITVENQRHRPYGTALGGGGQYRQIY